MREPSDAQVEAAIKAYWEVWDEVLANETGQSSRAANMRDHPEIKLLVRACMRAALFAASVVP